MGDAGEEEGQDERAGEQGPAVQPQRHTPCSHHDHLFPTGENLLYSINFIYVVNVVSLVVVQCGREIYLIQLEDQME